MNVFPGQIKPLNKSERLLIKKTDITCRESKAIISRFAAKKKNYKNKINQECYLNISILWGGGVLLDWFWCLIKVDGLFDSQVHHGVVMDCLPCGLLTEHAQTGRGLKHVQLLLQILNLLLMKISKINKDIIVSKYKISGPHDHKLKKILV